MQLLYFERGVLVVGVYSSLESEIDKESRDCLSIRECSVHLKLCSRNTLRTLRKDFENQCELNSCSFRCMQHPIPYSVRIK
jgi:hypothetical protein